MPLDAICHLIEWREEGQPFVYTRQLDAMDAKKKKKKGGGPRQNCQPLFTAFTYVTLSEGDILSTFVIDLAKYSSIV